MHDKAEINLTSYYDVADALVEMGHKPRFAEQAQRYVYGWLQGERPLERVSRATAYRYMRALRACGLDLSQPCNVTAMTHTLRTVTLTEPAAPSWYMAA